mgnify:CR=1 FL=1
MSTAEVDIVFGVKRIVGIYGGSVSEVEEEEGVTVTGASGIASAFFYY